MEHEKNFLTSIEMPPIARIQSPYQQRFGTPRQPHLNRLIESVIQFPESFSPSFFQGLELISHIWVIFVFDRSIGRGRSDRSTVKPPRAGGKRFGVFATRSPDRPNPIGLSLVRVLEVNPQKRCVVVEGGDWVDGTPVLDIKPYHKDADTPLGEVRDWWSALETDLHWEIKWAPSIEDPQGFSRVQVEAALREDPRPLGQRVAGDKIFGFLFQGWNVRFRFLEELRMIEVVEIQKP